MDSEALPPIPSPPGQRWREFRIQVLPLFVFVVVLGGLFTLWSRFVQPIAIVGLVETNAVNVTTTQAGLLTALAVNSFDEVTNGQVLGEVAPYDSDQIKAELAALASSAAVADAKASVLEWGKLDNAIMIRVNFLSQQILVEAARIEFEQASNVVYTDQHLLAGGNPAITRAKVQADTAQMDSLWSQWFDRRSAVEVL